jgi:3-hydroxyisobutyrate dehydrogenase-like beta-hydroxyacid dehydrogenase
VIVGIVHPGEMGAAVGHCLLAAGHDVLWASEGRSTATRRRARGFREVATLDDLVREAKAVLSICPPHAALDVAEALCGFDGIYVDANAVSPETSKRIASLHARFVDGGIIGGPPRAPGTRLYLTGAEAPAVAALFEATDLDARLSVDAGALKMVYAAWSKGTAALLLAIRDVARHYGVDGELADEWSLSVGELPERLAQAERSAAEKGWRWIHEMDEIAETFAAAGVPAGFHRAAAEVYRA